MHPPWVYTCSPFWRNKHLSVSWRSHHLQWFYIPTQNRISHCFHCFPIFCHKEMGLKGMILVFWMLDFKPMFSLSSFIFIKSLLNYSLLSAINVVSSSYLSLLIFLPEILISAYTSSSPAFHMMCSAYKFKLVLEKAQEPEIELPTSAGS